MLYSSMSLLYREKLPSHSDFECTDSDFECTDSAYEFKFFSEQPGSIWSPYTQWGYKLYEGSTYPYSFNE